MAKLQIKAACERLEVTREMMMRMIDRGEIEFTQTKSGRYQFEVEELDRWLAASVDPEDEEIKKMFVGSRRRRVLALFQELEEGKGIARMQAEKRIEELEDAMGMKDKDNELDLQWDIHATEEAKGNNED